MSITKQKSHRKELTAKQLAFVKQYIKTKNGTKSALAAYNTEDEPTANAIAVENLQKPLVRNEIQSLFKKQGLDVTDVFDIHKRNLVQDSNLKVSQTAVRDYYHVTKMIGSDSNNAGNVNIGIIIKK